jgi:hypothetical protein
MSRRASLDGEDSAEDGAVTPPLAPAQLEPAPAFVAARPVTG